MRITFTGTAFGFYSAGGFISSNIFLASLSTPAVCWC